jgi:hypothetical protein
VHVLFATSLRAGAGDLIPFDPQAYVDTLFE